RDHPKPAALRPNFPPFWPAQIWLSAARDSGYDRHAAQLRADLDAGRQLGPCTGLRIAVAFCRQPGRLGIAIGVPSSLRRK
ncbi:MAG TPA: hypothetical protein VER96_26695, partial [Polyangiaceae bacterium]|nr:hypothetical protein [Polyangiaceae bacterium]